MAQRGIIGVVSSTLFEAPPYDPAREHRRRSFLVTAAVVLVILGLLGYRLRNWPEERIANRFFDALQHKDFETAYAIWQHDPEWKQHADKYKRYPYDEFYKDWGPGGEWGVINSYHVDGSDNPKGGSGVVVQVTVNQRAEKARIWVEKADKTLTFSPY